MTEYLLSPTVQAARCVASIDGTVHGKRGVGDFVGVVAADECLAD